MFRKLTLIALGIGLTSTAGAQSTELIIRRPGQQDQVVRLDEKQAQEMATKFSAQLQGALKELKNVEFNRQGELAHLQLDSAMLRKALSARTTDMARQSIELGAQAGAMAARIAQPAMMTRLIQNAMSQPRLGIYVDNNGPQESDKYGALVASVSPGGPADKAGIRSGDIITKVDGKSLASTGAKDEDLPGVRLIAFVTKLTVGKSVSLDYRRGNDTHTTKVTPAEMEDDIAFTALAPSMLSRMPMRADSTRRLTLTPRAGGGFAAQGVPMPAIDRDGGMTVFGNAVPGGGGFTMAFSSGGPLSNLELVSLNEKLGSYFGTSEGVLVVDVGEKDAFGLQPGDVIVSVDGRKVSTSMALMRILRSYDKAESFKIQIMRQKKAETLTGKLP